jgi:SAM-dependent methyltransferase
MASYRQKMGQHYGTTDLTGRILTALEQAGKDPGLITREDLAAVAEFHIRGRDATRELAALADLREGWKVLDVGCGIGGAARTLAAEFGCRVLGVDIVREYIRTAQDLTELLGLAGGVAFRHGDFLSGGFDPESFDVVWVQHVLMNVEDKPRFFAVAFETLRGGGRLALHEVCAGSGGPLHFPVPWAGDPSISFLVTPEALRRQAAQGGFGEVAWQDITETSIRSIRATLAALAARPPEAPPPVALNLLMGETARDKLLSMGRNLEEGRIRVVLAVVAKAG